MPYIYYPNSYALIIKNIHEKYGFLIIINGAMDYVGYLKGDNLKEAYRELKKFMKKNKKYRYLPIYKNFDIRIQRAFEEFFT